MPVRSFLSTAQFVGLALLVACARAPAPAPPAPAPVVAPAVAAPAHIDLVAAPAEGEVAPYVKAELTRAVGDGRQVLVYVGATWCEPCQRFHNAAKAGLVDRDFGALRLLEFDLDRDRERLAAAGYASEMIPLFALPAADGKSTGRGIQGSIKGDGAVDNLRPRLQELLGRR